MDIIIPILNLLCIMLQIIFCIVLIVLFLIIIILCTNLKYQIISKTTIYQTYEENRYSQDLKVKATYLFKIISAYCIKKDSHIKIIVKIFGKTIFIKHIENNSIDDALFKNKSQEPDVDTQKNDTNKADNEGKTKEYKKKKQDCEIVKEEIENKDISDKSFESNEKNTVSKKSHKPSKEDDVKTKSTKTKDDGTKHKEKTILDCFLNKDFIVRALDALCKMLKKLKPYKFYVKLKIGFDAPSLTGQVIGVLYTIKGITGLNIQAEGEFKEEIKPDIYIYIRGKISIIKLILPYFFIIPIVVKFYLKKLFNILKYKLINKIKQKGE